MAALDSEIAFPFSEGTGTISDGSTNSITFTWQQGSFTWSQPGRSYTEQKHRGRRPTSGAPVLMETEDAEITGQCSFLITSLLGSTNVHPYEAMTLSGNASSWTTTARGSKKAVRMTLSPSSSSAATGGTQNVAFNYCVFQVECDMSGAEGLGLVTGSFTDHENKPTIT
jgi:hypothetical protein